MKIKFYAHASFRLEADAVVVVTDPYHPGKDMSGFEPIAEPADLVIMSSRTDSFHNDPSHLEGDPDVICALELPSRGTTLHGLDIRPFPTRERVHWLGLLRGRLPRRNAMYHLHFRGEGMRVLHTGDIGRPMRREHLDFLAGNVDVMLAIAGGVHNIELRDLDQAIAAIRPRVIIPMHYHSPRGRLRILPVTAFTARYPPERVRWIDGPEVGLTRDTLPREPQVYVLQQSR
ncbi:MAG TPA: MBL fold metallo-hydrolase [Thermoanaerobaculia bacterium]